MNFTQCTLLLFLCLFQEKYFSFMTMISPLDSICRKVTAEIILSVSGEISLRDGTNPTFLHLEIHTTTSQTIYIFINFHIFHWIRTCEGEGGSNDPFNQKILNAYNFFLPNAATLRFGGEQCACKELLKKHENQMV